MGEKANKKIFAISLDWEKTFDETDHNKLFEALHRIGMDEKLIRII